MNVVDLARIQFAVTATLHFLFVALTLGLVTIVAVMQTRAILTKDPAQRAAQMRRVRFWGGLYVINYALGIISGLTQEFQFGLNWSGLSHIMGNVVGAPLAIETVVAFFLESTFLGLWAFGFNRVSPRAHLGLIWGVSITAYASTFWIMVVNGFMQKPVGYEMRHGTAYVTDWGAILTNGATWYAVLHIAGAVTLLAGLFMAAVSSFHLRRDRDIAFFRPTLVQGSRIAGVGALVTAGAGTVHLLALEDYQPEKYAVLMGAGGAELDRARAAAQAAHGPGDWMPPAWVGAASLLMLLLGILLVFLTWIPATAARGKDPDVPLSRRRFRMRLPAVLLPLGIVAMICGWLSREVGRQPWMVTGELTVRDAIGNVSAGGMLASLVAFTLVLGILAVADWALISHYARQGPDGGLLGDEDLFPDAARRKKPRDGTEASSRTEPHHSY
ncbi:cytochrome ubiquinol oxidase subunit I [Streptomyces tubercidicus]|uniref:Cytochrome ubiquinol oxidase subunit I n=1 Tax=Streptomyces tubercidicus TaxID=47759 RepID=A0A640UZV4_9ACTN|nr:cytochrome ubiquinol oxidase subunit I [Streptomyces tubercidicus]WAU14463.1 cytochrome ubiquinol oxidase subunit I [Streptomyces tubercidicus]GFE40201.1 cytochrome ubiquinol oxidase subunit I [Streptomyces tubercidicus]